VVAERTPAEIRNGRGGRITRRHRDGLAHPTRWLTAELRRLASLDPDDPRWSRPTPRREAPEAPEAPGTDGQGPTPELACAGCGGPISAADASVEATDGTGARLAPWHRKCWDAAHPAGTPGAGDAQPRPTVTEDEL
jgi:hypothetical protein